MLNFSSHKKNQARLRRARKTRKVIGDNLRLCVFKTSRNIYAQVIKKNNTGKSFVLCASSTLDKKLFKHKAKANKKSAQIIGQDIATKCIKSNISKVAFDRSGYAYHGIVKQIAEFARKGGLSF